MQTKPLLFIAGPCVIESKALCFAIAQELKAVSETLNVPVVFKASFDKANRTSKDSFRGLGIRQGLEILNSVKKTFGLRVLTDIHTPDQAAIVAKVVDIIQIPAFLSRQTDLIIAAAKTGKTINIKKAQFAAPEDMEQIIKKVLSTNNKKIMLTERGASFGYHNLVVDMRAFPSCAHWVFQSYSTQHTQCRDRAWAELFHWETATWSRPLHAQPLVRALTGSFWKCILTLQRRNPMLPLHSLCGS